MKNQEEKLEECRSHVESLLARKGHAGLQETSYPSQSLNFLKRLQGIPQRFDKVPKLNRDASHQNEPPREAAVKLKIIIAGAGLGGLAAAIALRRRGHEVTVFEKAPELGEVGAGIQVPPNSCRLLERWGLRPYLQGKAVEPDAIRLRRWQNGEVLSHTKLVPEFEENFEAPYYVVHRANLQLAMYELAASLGVRVRVNAGVRSYNAEATSVVLENGETHHADLIVAADGVKSEARRVVLGGQDQPPQQCGYAAYRAMVNTDLMRADPEISWLLDIPGQNLWVGEGRHVMAYSIAGGKSFNMVLSHPEDSDPSTWNQNSVLEDMKRHFEGWDPCLVKIISLIRTTLKWPLLSGKPLPRWLSSSGNLLIIGDAAHSMVPYMSEGAAMAVEDGAALAEILSLIESPSELRSALQVFERHRILRTGQMQEASLVNGKLWHFADGPEQEARDAAMRSKVAGDVEESPNQFSDPVTAQWTYGYDAEVEIREAWNEIRARTSTP
ncbi:salicylate hydroxylase [Karstenula rhodostoma CBS 690.94]|uniref:Salicylate hydroxylase n=1 Tax=Karstenula rhodostoma CBS 690.94 TaxID=1392251 RepID=A0A9P4PCF8_9PLEO|nr:salicylate hydroxylase [Karstenula rhodostoma CBS 690.94]